MLGLTQGRAVVLVNLDVAGTLLVTNFRLMFIVSIIAAAFRSRVFVAGNHHHSQQNVVSA